MKKQSIFSVILAFAAIAIALVSCDSDPSSVRLAYNQATFVEAKPDEGFNYGYYYYIPQSIRDAPKKYLLVQSNNSGMFVDINDPLGSFGLDDIEIHNEAARRGINGISGYAHELNCVLMVPVIPREWSTEAWAQGQSLPDHQQLSRVTFETNDRGARVDLQLIAMVDDLKALLGSAGINLETKILINGFSASGTFGNRFTAIHPGLVQAAALGGETQYFILPTASRGGQSLYYPYGIADLAEITGAPFNREEYIKVPQFMFIGSEDTNSSFVLSRWVNEIDVLEELGCSAVQSKVYEGVGHEITSEMTQDIFAFFKSNM